MAVYAFFIVLLPFRNLICSQWEQTSGMEGMGISCLSTQGNTIYAGTYKSGVFVSTDNAEKWTPLHNSFIGKSINSIAIKGSYIFIGTQDNGIYVSGDGGNNWTRPDFIDSRVICLYANENNIFAGTRSKGVLISSDDGRSWSQRITGLDTTWIHSITQNGSNIFAGTWGGGIFRSYNDCLHWSKINSGLKNFWDDRSMRIYTFAAHGGAIFAGTWGKGIFASSDDGDNWNQITMGLKDLFITSMAIEQDWFLFSTLYDVYFSGMVGYSWEKISNEGLPEYPGINALIITDTLVLIGTKNGVFKRSLKKIIASYRNEETYTRTGKEYSATSSTEKQRGNASLSIRAGNSMGYLIGGGLQFGHLEIHLGSGKTFYYGAAVTTYTPATIKNRMYAYGYVGVLGLGQVSDKTQVLYGISSIIGYRFCLFKAITINAGLGPCLPFNPTVKTQYLEAKYVFWVTNDLSIGVLF